MKDFSSEPSNWHVESGRFLVSGEGSQIELRIVIDGLKFIGQMRSGERAEVQLSLGTAQWELSNGCIIDCRCPRIEGQGRRGTDTRPDRQIPGSGSHLERWKAKMISLNRIRVSSPLIFRNLEVSPLLTSQAREADYFTLDEALSTGKARVTEVSETGSVPELSLLNGTDRPILLLDGEELVGAKQNRICNLTILAAANAETIIPVSCVEAGRWYWRSQAFSTSENILFAEGRARKAYDISESLEKFGAPRARQDAVWSDISGKIDRLGAFTSERTSPFIRWITLSMVKVPAEERVVPFGPVIDFLARYVGFVPDLLVMFSCLLTWDDEFEKKPTRLMKRQRC